MVDLVLLGATGFTGRLTATYLSGYPELKWGIAGRRKLALEDLRTELDLPELPVYECDVHDPASLDELCGKTRVICSVVGPYSLHGSSVVSACVRNGVHYCDLAGEVHWIREMIDQYHEAALSNQTRLVFCCGFDSIPSDMAVFWMQNEAQNRFGTPLIKIKNGLRAMKGGMSGGTYASLTAIQEAGAKDTSIYKTLFHPYALNPRDKMNGPDGKDLLTVAYDKELKAWKSPFVMASINTRVVRRSVALDAYPYGQYFTYEEFALHSGGIKGRLKAIRNAIPLALVSGAKPGSFRKKILDRVFPQPGEGPTPAQQESGFFYFKVWGTTEAGDILEGTVRGDKDPGYGFTSRMLGEAAACLAVDDLPPRYGCLTPATAMGSTLFHRLVENAGMKFNIK